MSALYTTNPLTKLFVIRRTIDHADIIYGIARLYEECCGDRCQNSRAEYDCGGRWLARNRVFRPVYAWEEVLQQANRSTQLSVYHDFLFFADRLHIKRMELERKATTIIIVRALWPPTVYSWDSSDQFQLGPMHQILL